ncbi:MAG: metallophosphoesterase [Rhodospirillales bacterium]|nr:metallophosphoesterase [Rhodospirillales bacterium]
MLFAGDPHGNFTPILRACADHPPGTLILLGDCGCAAPLPRLLAPLIDAGWAVRWILGNHDAETDATWDNLVGAAPEGDIGLQVVTIGGVRMAGLPGVFKPRVWYPRADAPGEPIDPPQAHTRAELAAQLGPGDGWRGGLPLRHRDTIFPEDFQQLATLRFDVLVSHEAPTTHRHGFAPIDALAAECGARLIVHGHHHESYAATLPNGIAVRGLGLSEVWPLPR